MSRALPKALLLDLDDTILNESGGAGESWRDACLAAGTPRYGIDTAALVEAIDRKRYWYWSDPGRHRIGRLDLHAARREIVGMALAEAGAGDPELAGEIAGAYGRLRDAALEPFPQAIETVRWFRERGCRLALLTNDAAAAQGTKLARFDLRGLFDAVFIEGELGFGKPDPRVYELALGRLAVTAAETWMVGDNLVWDVGQPQSMGVFGIWVDARGAGVPEGTAIRPNHTVRTLADLRAFARFTAG